MKLNRLFGKVLGKDGEKPAASTAVASATRRPQQPARARDSSQKSSQRSSQKSSQATGGSTTEDQWLRVLEEAEPEHNPYDTYSWELDPGTEERRLKRKRFDDVEPPPQDQTGGINPYNTGVFRRSGWDG
jgi:hypothetical protein